LQADVPVFSCERNLDFSAGCAMSDRHQGVFSCSLISCRCWEPVPSGVAELRPRTQELSGGMAHLGSAAESKAGRLTVLWETRLRLVKTHAPGKCQPCTKPCKVRAAKLCFPPGTVFFASCYR